MALEPGSILISAPSMDDPLFEKVVLLLTEVNDNGATGFVINQLFDRRFNELTEFRHSTPLPMFAGGPVEKESLFFLHSRPDLVPDGTLVRDGIFYGGDFRKAVSLVNNKGLGENEIKLFVGYSGWDAGQLEDELREGSWIPVFPLQSPVFGLSVNLWEELRNL